jgi:two-component system, NtrC family, sensor kinase
MLTRTVGTNLPRWDLAAEAIAVRIRWLGLILGYVYVNFGTESPDRLALNWILSIGLIYTTVDTVFSWQERVFLGRYPIAISIMEAIFISMLAYFDGDLEGPFRFYYLLSLICCAIRHPRSITVATCGLDCISYITLACFIPHPSNSRFPVIWMIALLGWVTWAASAMAKLWRTLGEHLSELNEVLLEQQAHLESRIAEGTRELQETQAQLMHQDKMAGFGLLAAGIAHEVGNPLTGISTVVQMLERRDCDQYTREKLGLVDGQLSRIQKILRELIDFSRPANPDRSWFTVHDMTDQAMQIAKYYRGIKSRTMKFDVPLDLPHLHGVKDQLVQVVFNLLLNAIDATSKGGTVQLTARSSGNEVILSVQDDGVGIPANVQSRVFEPYFTNKKQGTGLGLFVSRKIITEHCGTIRFLSQTGVGTTFEVHLPAATTVLS